MPRISIRTTLLVVTACCIFATGIAFLILSFRPLLPPYYVKYLNVDPELYLEVEELDALGFDRRIYAYDENQFVDAIHDAETKPQIADDRGFVPVLKFDADTYVILRKWVNESGGLAISDDPDFASKLHNFDDDFVVEHISGNIYYWDLDLERDSYR